MQYVGQSRYFVCALTALLYLLVLSCTASALSLAYDRNYGAAYVNILQGAADVPLEPHGYAQSLLDLFQDRRVDAVEIYEFQAVHFQRGTSEALYWYPHFTPAIVLAVGEDAPVSVTGWADLTDGVTVVLPDRSPEREIFFLALAQHIDSDFDASFAQLARMRAQGTLRFYPVHRGMRGLLAERGGRDVYVLFAHEAERLIRCGARLRIVAPREGTLACTKGILSRVPLTFAAQLPDDLAAAGYPPVSADVRTIASDFPHALHRINARYYTEVMERPLLTPREPHERFTILVLTLAATVVWGACIRRRVLSRGTRRAVLLLIVMLLLWELDRTVKILVLAHSSTLEHILWYLYYVFRGGLSVALLWIAWSSDENVLDRTMPPWLRAVFGINLLIAVLILCNDLHHQFFYFVWSPETMEWSEHLAWGAYAYWTLWFVEILAALLLLLEKARAQQVLRRTMVLPFVLLALFVVYSIAYQYAEWVTWAEMTAVTALFFLLLIELCLRTGLMPSNRFHQAFFTHSQLAMQLVNAKGEPAFASAVSPRAPARDVRTARMEVDGGALLWQEDLSLLHEQQRRLALTRSALRRSRALLHEEHTIRRQLLRLTLQKQLSDELEAILAAKRPLLRAFREQLMETEDEAEVTLLIRRLNLLSSYLKKRCVLFLKGQEDGRIRADELSMAVSETCTYLRPLGLRVGVEWTQREALDTEAALVLFDFFAELLTRAVAEGISEVFCRFADGAAFFLLEEADWIAPWIGDWQEHRRISAACRDHGYALALTVRPADAVPDAARSAAQAAGDAASALQGDRMEERTWNG